MKSALGGMLVLACAAAAAPGQSLSSVAIGCGGGLQGNGRAALAGQTFTDEFQISGRTLLLGAAHCWQAGDGGGGGGCTGQEILASAKCVIREGVVSKAVVLVKEATPGQQYTALLDTGQSLTRVANDRRKVKFVFKGGNRPPCGPNGVTVCGLRKSFTCGC